MNYKLSVFLLSGLTLLAGCQQQIVKPDEMKKNNRFAIVAINGTTSGFGMSENEEIQLLTKVDEVASKELSQSRDFKLINSALVKKSKNYAAIKGDSTDGVFTLKTAQGYKKFNVTDDEAKPNLKNLMAELKLTGVIQITASYALSNSGISVSGLLPVPVPVSVGSASGKVNLAIVAVNSQNEVIWRDMIEVTTKDSVGQVMGVGNTAKLYPKLIDISQEAVHTAMKNLDDKLK